MAIGVFGYLTFKIRNIIKRIERESGLLSDDLGIDESPSSSSLYHPRIPTAEIPLIESPPRE